MFLFDVGCSSLHLEQDPMNDSHCGGTVWEAGIVLSKYCERELGRKRLLGKTCLDLGSGCGIVGMSAAYLGANVCLTDQAGVLPMLTKNVERNKAANPECGNCIVRELDWGSNPLDVMGEDLKLPVSFVFSSDCVFKEALIPLLLESAYKACHSNITKVFICNEYRTQSIHDTFMTSAAEKFEIKKIPIVAHKLGLDSVHSNMQLFRLTPKI